MAEAEYKEYKDVRVAESLRVKIGEVKNLPASSFSGSARNTCCAIKIDSEEIFRTSTVERSTNPFFGAEFQGEIPKKFRYLSFYVHEVGNKNKVLGKVSLKKEELYKYHQKEHWFPLTYQDGDIDVQGKVQIEVKLDEFLSSSPETSHRLTIRVLECSDLTVINGSCNPYAVVTLSYGKSKDVKKTGVKKKTICPQFDETFYFFIDGKGQSQEKNIYSFDDFLAGELSVSLFHDDSKVSREVLGNIFKGCFLGEVKIPINELDTSQPHKAWYCLQAKEHARSSDQILGSLRLRISYTADYVFPSKYYNGLRNLILQSAETKPFTSSTVFILGEVVSHKETVTRENAAQPLVKLFLHHGKLVPLVHAMADWEMSCTVDANTLFRGNSLLTKMVDELMKIVGMPYLQDTLKSFVTQVVSESKPCEIDPTRLKDGEDAESNLTSLHSYVKEALTTIVSSGLVCPAVMRDVFSTLKAQAVLSYPDNTAVRYHAVTSFIFLRFFTAAIMGPNLFDLHTDVLEPSVQRTLTLISKGVSGLVTLVSSKSNNVTAKEEYMAPLFEMFPKSTQADIQMFLDIVSSSSGPYFKNIEAPVILKEGFLIKRAQGRKKFGLKNFKKRFFRLTNQSFSYSKCKDKQLFEIPVSDILAVERLEEDSFKMKYMFQVIHAHRVLYIQANNCVEEKEWMDILTKVCKSNKNRLKYYHPAAFVNNHWLCCKSTEQTLVGCTPVSGDLPLADILSEAGEVDSDREVEKIHSIFLSAIDLLDALQETCGSQVVYSGDTEQKGSGLGCNIEDPSSCFSTIAEIQRCIITLEQEHIQYLRSVQRRTVIGSIDTPIGDESSADLVRNMNRSSERLSRHGSRSSNASNISRRSFRACRSRGGSFREREKGQTESEGVRKSLSGDVATSSRSLCVDFGAEVKKAASYDVMATESREGKGEIACTINIDVVNSSEFISLDAQVYRNCISTVTSSRGTDSGIKDCSVSSPTDGILSATDSEVFTSPDVRQSKTSTGFKPSAFLYTDDHIASLNHTHSFCGGSFEHISITQDVHVGRVYSDSHLPVFSSPSQLAVGVLETSLEDSDIVTTTTINITRKPEEAVPTFTPEIQYQLDEISHTPSSSQPLSQTYHAPSSSQPLSETYHAPSSSQPLSETYHAPSSSQPLNVTCHAPSSSQPLIVHSASNTHPDLLFQPSGGHFSAGVDHTNCINGAHHNQNSEIVGTEPGMHLSTKFLVVDNDTYLSQQDVLDVTSKIAVSNFNNNNDDHHNNNQSNSYSFYSKCDQIRKENLSLIVANGVNSGSNSGSSVSREQSSTVSEEYCAIPPSHQASLDHSWPSQDKTLSSQHSSDSAIISSGSVKPKNQALKPAESNGNICNLKETASLSEASGSKHEQTQSHLEEKYSLPELTSSFKTGLHGVDPQSLACCTLTPESSSSTSVVSPSELAALEMMVTSSGSDSVPDQG